MFAPYSELSRGRTPGVEARAPDGPRRSQHRLETIAIAATDDSRPSHTVCFAVALRVQSPPGSLSAPVTVWKLTVHNHIRLKSKSLVSKTSTDVCDSSLMTRTADGTAADERQEERVDGAVARLRHDPGSTVRGGGTPDPHVLARSGDGPRSVDPSVTVAWNATWDSLALYVQILVAHGDSSQPHGDTVDLFVAGEPSATPYGPHDFHLVLDRDGTVWTGVTPQSDTDPLTVVSRNGGTGWSLAMGIPWRALGGAPSEDRTLGFDVHYRTPDGNTLAWGTDPDDAVSGPDALPVVVLSED